uniref:Uncharacterized protein n=1 Tax=viral metagenome TaxID=1070528 RepID=A0A6H1ZF69_9ZZZZ
MAYVWCPQCNESLGTEPEFSGVFFGFDDDEWQEALKKWFWQINKHYCYHGNCLNRACKKCHRRELEGLEQQDIIGYTVAA